MKCSCTPSYVAGPLQGRRSHVLFALLLFSFLFSAVHAQTTNLPTGEVFIKGTAAGDYQDTFDSDDVYESITEIRAGNLSLLEHKWTFDVDGGDSVTFNVEAYKTDAGDEEDFVFSYSPDGSTYIDMVTVTNETDTDIVLSYSLPVDTRGILFVRAMDTDRTRNHRKLETLHVDQMYIVCTGEPPPPIDNLLTNPNFEQGTEYWYGYDGISLTATASPVHGGTGALYVSSRSYDWQGPIHDLYNIMAQGNSYSNSIWVRLDNTNSATATLTVKQTVDGTDYYTHLQTATISDSEWTQLSGIFTNEYTGTLDGLNLYVEGPPAGVAFYVDDGVVEGSGDWETEANLRIESIRKRDARLQLVNVFGSPLAFTTVSVRQVNHDFGFGSALSHWVTNSPEYVSFFTNHFEWAVFENETKWSEIEPTQGNIDYSTPDALAQFCDTNNIKMRGHCAFWSVEQYIQDWVVDLTSNQLSVAVSNHLDSVITRYADQFLHWDVNNEMLHGNFYSNRLGDEIRPWMFERASELDGDAELFVNDFGVVSYSDTDDYVQHVQGMIADGAPIHGVGAQCHMWEMNPYLLLARFETLSTLDLPVWCTEFDVSHPDENERARLLEIFYRTAFSHPTVEGILMWGFWASNHWRGGDAAIVNADWTTNAAGTMYESLMSEWTTTTSLVTDVEGYIAFRGFHGSYDVSYTPTGGAYAVYRMPLTAGEDQQNTVLIHAGIDSDGDGMPDEWEDAYGLHSGEDDADDDNDTDGINNGAEYIAATHPTNANSFLRLTASASSSSGRTAVTFDTSAHRLYTVQYRTNLLSGGWQELQSTFYGNGSIHAITNESTERSSYYRLGVALP